MNVRFSIEEYAKCVPFRPDPITGTLRDRVRLIMLFMRCDQLNAETGDEAWNVPAFQRDYERKNRYGL